MQKLIKPAIKHRKDAKLSATDYRFLFSGDLRQLNLQAEFLVTRGFDLSRVNAYPAVRTEAAFIRALRCIWESKCPGWWHYCHKYVEYHICTIEAFKTALDSL